MLGGRGETQDRDVGGTVGVDVHRVVGGGF